MYCAIAGCSMMSGLGLGIDIARGVSGRLDERHFRRKNTAAGMDFHYRFGFGVKRRGDARSQVDAITDEPFVFRFERLHQCFTCIDAAIETVIGPPSSVMPVEFVISAALSGFWLLRSE